MNFPREAGSPGPFDLPNPPIAEPDESSRPVSALDNPFEQIAVPPTSRVKQIWAIGGGKGGVGKSLISSNLAIALSRLGNKVIAADLDLGGANLHTALGAGLPNQTLSDFVTHRTDSLQECVTPSGVPNLEIISGAQDSIGIANMNLSEKIRVMQKVRELDADYVLFDLGAGTGLTTLDFFLYADVGVIVLLPEPTSIENAYRFIKSAYYRRLSVAPKLKKVRHLIELAMDSKNPNGIRTPSDLFREVNQFDPESGIHLKDEIDKFRLKLIVNQARTQTDVDIGFSVKSVCKKYFGIEVDYIGYLDHDSAVWQAVRRKRPLILEFPNSQLVGSLERITSYIVRRYGHVRNQIV
jgi:flagellar biosynthesis protein FlhG